MITLCTWPAFLRGQAHVSSLLLPAEAVKLSYCGDY